MADLPERLREMGKAVHDQADDELGKMAVIGPWTESDGRALEDAADRLEQIEAERDSAFDALRWIQARIAEGKQPDQVWAAVVAFGLTRDAKATLEAYGLPALEGAPDVKLKASDNLGVEDPAGYCDCGRPIYWNGLPR